MLTLKKPMKQYYSEAEAAHTLCISLEASTKSWTNTSSRRSIRARRSGIYPCRVAFALGVGRARAWSQRGCNALEKLSSARIIVHGDR